MFNLNSKFVEFGNKVADLIVLNILTIICSLPIITLGASFTAMHHVLLRLHEEGETSVLTGFFKAFKNNFKQATVIWVIYLIFGIMLACDYYILTKVFVGAGSILKYILILIFTIYLLSLTWVFILLSRYENAVINTLKNAVIIGMSQIGYTMIMLMLFLLPFAAMVIFPITIPFVILMGFTVAGYIQVKYYKRVFEKCEKMN